MTGYWNRPDLSAAALRNGWLHTGDAGHLDQDGYLYVTGRITEMIITGGENVYPVEVENVLYAHPAVAEAAVVGLPDDRWASESTRSSRRCPACGRTPPTSSRSAGNVSRATSAPVASTSATPWA